jgi:hypothetical protein
MATVRRSFPLQRTAALALWPQAQAHANLAFCSALSAACSVSYTGTVKNGVVVLPPDARLPEGAVVEVVPRALESDEDPFLQAAARASRPRPHWPKDYALNHGHYVSGEPKKA